MSEQSDVTRALERHKAGDTGALDAVLPLVYEELRALARRELRRERADHTLAPTALVHEAYLKLVKLERPDWSGRAHFFGACAREMRRILIDHARAQRATRRGGGVEHVALEEVPLPATARPAELIALDDALSRLERVSERRARVVECRYFAGMGVEETAAVLGTSPATVKREWTLARAWLHRELAH